MTVWHRRLIAFMHSKRDWLWPSFFVEEDDRAILRWPDSKAKFAYELLMSHEKHMKGTYPEACPFCLLYHENMCRGCEYAELHGRCPNKDSGFRINLKEWERNHTDKLDTVISNQVYLEIWQQIRRIR